METIRSMGKKKEANRERVMTERKCFVCEGFGHIAWHCRIEGRLRRIKK